mmetsp:Transcript_35372/g.101903  ORF Transcript_35372/g.101903 Transcript_35372/m.101903 type:complete len:227 (-) Transcript_35372:17-697(-)
MASTTTMVSLPPRGKRSATEAFSPSSSARPSKKQQRDQRRVSPLHMLHKIFGEQVDNHRSSDDDAFLRPTDAEIAAYDLEVVRVIRNGDLDRLTRLHAEGKDLNAANRFGESLLHMACRRGRVPILKFMLQEAQVRVDRKDDFGRTPLHDACWTPSPNFDIMDELLNHVDPFMLLAKDVRGSTPFDYCREEHWEAWVKYLSERRDRIASRIREVQSVTPSLLDEAH